jgi:hypothetical protein
VNEKQKRPKKLLGSAEPCPEIRPGRVMVQSTIIGGYRICVVGRVLGVVRRLPRAQRIGSPLPPCPNQNRIRATGKISRLQKE